MHDDERQYAVDLLEDALHWQLPSGRWLAVNALVDSMAEAFARGADEPFRRSVTEFELLGPVRGVSAQNPPREPAGDRARERINELLHTLGQPRPSRQPGPGPDERAADESDPAR